MPAAASLFGARTGLKASLRGQRKEALRELKPNHPHPKTLKLKPTRSNVQLRVIASHPEQVSADVKARQQSSAWDVAPPRAPSEWGGLRTVWAWGN